jgi:protoporphyrinogen oxidase
MKVVVIGGGVAGMAAAYRLMQSGHDVRLFEASPFMGGLVRTFEVGGGRLEAFYHHLFSTDTTILGLIDELGLGDRVVWVDSKVGFYDGGRLYDFVTPLDLLRFRPLPLLDRVRLGLMGLWLRRKEDWSYYETVTAKEWITRHVGRRVYERVWGPLLRGKFGAAEEEVAMAWLWSKIHLRFQSRSGGPMQKERLGYLMGSFGVYIDELERRLRDGGVELNLSRPVRHITLEGGRASGLVTEDGERVEADAVIAAVPSGAFEKMAPALPEDYRRRLNAVRWQWALCMVLAMDRPFSHIYWMNVADRSLPFLALVEHTNFIGPEHYGGNHVIYISNYLEPTHPYFSMSEEELASLFYHGMQQINPSFRPDQVRQRWLFKGPYAQPIITTRYREILPDHRTPIPGLYLANMAQIYPEDRGQNYSIRMGETVARMVVEDSVRAPVTAN